MSVIVGGPSFNKFAHLAKIVKIGVQAHKTILFHIFDGSNLKNSWIHHFMDPKFKMAATRKPKLSCLANIWHKFHDFSINSIYLDDEKSICDGLKVIRMKLYVLV